jgi:predicted TIM-barrel fold metal-dependent hydrolase
MGQNRYLFTKEHIPLKARYPVIDAHNHLWGGFDKMDEIVTVMDEVGVISYCDLTSNVAISWEGGGYSLGSNEISKFFQSVRAFPPGKFYGFTTATFNKPITKPLYLEPKEFVEKTIEVLHEHTRQGTKGLKILKELGLHYTDKNGKLIHLDNPVLAPIWEEVGHLGIPVLIHQSDPYGFFQPITPENEHYDTLRKYPDWNFSDAKFPKKSELLKRRDNLIRNFPNTVFMLPHVANFAENIEYVSELLDNNKNIYIDFSARIDELGRQPYTSREFMIKYQDRIYFGTDMPASKDMYRCYFRFLETYDEYFIPPDYDGTFGRFRWHIYGLGLPAEVLKKIYYKNILKIIPSLSEELGINPDES